MQHFSKTRNIFGLILLTTLSQQAYADCAVTLDPNGTGGQDVVCSAADADGYTGTANGDNITIPAGASVDNVLLNTIETLAGDDTITLSGGTVTSGNEAINSGLDNDTITVDSGSITSDAESIRGGNGNDTITINGGSITSDDDDAIVGDDGDDVITINGGTINGDNDGIQGDNGEDIITINGGSITATFEGAQGDDGDDTIILNNGTIIANDDGLAGDAGNDTITVNAGSITSGPFGRGGVTGGTGNDIITINGGSITETGAEPAVSGGSGDDTVIFGGDAILVGNIGGGGGTDTLRFTMAVLAADQPALVAYLDDPANVASGSIVINGLTYTWINFEALEHDFQLLPSENIPTLQQWALFLLISLLGLLGITASRKTKETR